MTQTQSPPVAAGQESDVLAKLNLAAGHCAVVGLQWGDEGKGKIVDLLGRRFDLVVRYNGGANAGHSVQVGDERYALHLIPSGILYPDKVNVIANGVVVDPQALLKEVTDLRQRGVKIDKNLLISDRAHVVFPYHKLQDALMEMALSRDSGDGSKIGTTGRGIGPCYADKAERSTAIRVGEILDPEHFQAKLRHVVRVKNLMLGALANGVGAAFTPFDADQIFAEYRGYAQALAGQVRDTTQLLHQAMAGGKHILFEGANATLLDVDHGTYPFVTSSNCSSLGVHTGTGVPGHQVRQVVGIMKAYSTRVGGGPFPTELDNATGQRIRQVGNEYGTTTGRPRRCGWLDLVAVKYSAAVSGAAAIGLMLLDVLAGLDKLQVCVGYRHKGTTLETFPADARVLAAVEPIYREVEGFAGPVSDAKDFDGLPTAARRYVGLIEEFVGVPVRVVSVGPRRDQTLVR